MRPVLFATLAVAFISAAAIGVLPRAALAQGQPEHLMITITDSDLTSNVTGPLGGLYVVTVRNDSSAYRGIVMKGIDRAVSPFIRFTPVLGPGQQVTFRWYFPSDRNVAFRDLLQCGHAQRTCMAARTGGLTESITFG